MPYPNLVPHSNVASNSTLPVRNCRTARYFGRVSFWTLSVQGTIRPIMRSIHRFHNPPLGYLAATEGFSGGNLFS